MALQYRRAWVTLAVVDWARSCQFYQKLLTQAPQSVLPNQYAEFQIAELRLGIYRSRPTESPAPPLPFPPLSLCLEVADLGAAIVHLTQLGYPPSGPIITAAHGQEAYAYDPDGHRIILYQPISSAT